MPKSTPEPTPAMPTDEPTRRSLSIAANPRGPVRPDQIVVSVTQASKMLGVGRNTIYELLEAGHLRSVKLGDRARARRIPIADVYAVAGLDPIDAVS